ncbi:MAG: transposase, partial [Rikenellaceae bacterium]
MKNIAIIILPYLHRSKKFMAKVEQWRELDLWIYFLPPYSPELNII